MKQLLAPYLLLAALCAAAIFFSSRPAPVPPPRAAAPQDPGRRADDPSSPIAVDVRFAQPVVHSGGELFAQIEVTGVAGASELRAPASLVLVLDRSGSMRGQKLEDAKAAAAQLVERLSADDRVGLVHYGSDVSTVASARCDERHRRELLRTIHAITDDGGTNISAALDAAFGLLDATEGRGRVILLTDGNPTEGDVSEEGLRRRVAGLRERGHTVSSLGVGLDYNELLMQALADAGGGIYGFIENSATLSSVLDRELQHAARQVARSVELIIEPHDPATGTILGRSARTQGHAWTVPLPNLAAGQKERVMVKLRAPRGGEGETREALEVRVRYRRPASELEESTGPKTAAVRLTDSAADVLSHRDEAVFANALRAVGAGELSRARRELEAGRPEVARGIFGNIRNLFSASADLLAPDIALLGASADALAGAPSSAVLAAEQKKAHQRALTNFGQTTY